MAHPETRRGGACQHRPRIFNHPPEQYYQIPTSPATPGPILARHYFRGCELLEVAHG